MNKRYKIPENSIEIVINDKGVFITKLKLIKNKNNWKVIKHLELLKEIK